jgi:hypothetical protein
MIPLRFQLGVLILFASYPHLYSLYTAAQQPAPVMARAHAGRLASTPYVSGDTFRAHADFIFDETQQNITPGQVKDGNVIFIKTDMLPEFFSKIHPHIQARYILVTHNSDYPAPGPFANMLDDSKIIAWFAQNVEGRSHNKLHPIPIGLANRYWAHGDTNVLGKARELLPKITRKHLLYVNFAIQNRPDERGHLYNMFFDKAFCLVSGPKALYTYFTELTTVLFVLSPRGSGLDCHRTWEALYMGAIPIVKSSACDSMYDGLPVLIVHDWAQVTEDFLKAKYEEMSHTVYDLSRVYARYWLRKIDGYRKNL